MNRPVLLSLAAAVLLLAGCRDEVVNRVRLVLPEGAGGLNCVDSAGTLLISRAGADPMRPVAFVVDYLDFEGVSGCRAGSLLRWCEGVGCPIIRRQCREFPVGQLTPIERPTIERVLGEWGVFESDAPNRKALVRMVVTTERCDALQRLPDPGPPSFPVFECASLMGCSYSPPMRLDEARGQLELDLDALTGCTEETVRVCAGIGQPGVAFDPPFCR